MTRLSRGVAVGTSGALGALVLDAALARLAVQNVGLRSALRAGGGIAAAVALDRLTRDAKPSTRDTFGAVADGLIAGPLMLSMLDLGVSFVGERRLDPPPAGSAAQLGAPWAPSPPWAP